MSRSRQRRAVERNATIGNGEPADLTSLENEQADLETTETSADTEADTEAAVTDENQPLEAGTIYQGGEAEPVVDSLPENEPVVVIDESNQPILVDESAIKVENYDEPLVSDTSINLSEEQAFIQSTIQVDALTYEVISQQVDDVSKWGINGLLSYIEKMNQPDHVRRFLDMQTGHVVDIAPKLQVELFNNLMDIINKSDDVSFQLAMDYILKVFHDHAKSPDGSEGVLGYMRLMRYTENADLSETDLEAYGSLMRLLTVTANPLTRRDALQKDVDFGLAFKYGFTETAKSRLMQYFQNGV